ncbi:MAG: LamG-like jellyroll fold domain-containing protein, partial [Verrucomicrobiota bacterium]
LSSVGSAISGTAVISSGKVLYTPAAGFMGADTISYTALAAATTASSTITASVLFDNEIWIPLDEGSGVNVKAISTTSPATGTLIGTSNPSLSWLDGKYKKCLTFDGVDDQVDFPTLSLPTGASPRTFSCWLKTAATTTDELQTIFSYGTSAAGQRFTVRLNNTSGVASSQAIRLDVDGGSIVGTKTVNDGLWHHIAIVNADQNNDSIVNLNETLLYVDGVLDPVSSSSSMPLATVAGFTPCIGGSNHAANYNFNGAIDDVRIFPRALSYAEVAGLKIAMDQSSGSTDSDGDGATDLQESIAGTDPYNANSVFKITSSTRSTQAITLHWSAVAGKTYSVEESPDLAVWTPVPNVAAVVPVTSNPDATVSVPMSIQAKRFLRLSVK